MRLLLAHQIEGRSRLRALTRPVDEAGLCAFAERLAGLSGVEAVDCRPHTGSLVVEHPQLDAAGLAAGLARLGGVMVSPATTTATRPSGLVPLRRGLDGLDGVLGQLTAGGLDIRTLAFATLVGLAARQVLHGQVMAPAISLLWWAFELLPSARAGEAGPSDAGDG